MVVDGRFRRRKKHRERERKVVKSGCIPQTPRPTGCCRCRRCCRCSPPPPPPPQTDLNCKVVNLLSPPSSDGQPNQPPATVAVLHSLRPYSAVPEMETTTQRTTAGVRDRQDFPPSERSRERRMPSFAHCQSRQISRILSVVRQRTTSYCQFGMDF